MNQKRKATVLENGKGLITPQAFVRAVMESGQEYRFGIDNWANEYAEPGYSAPELGILFGNWNDKTKWNVDTNTQTVLDDRPSRFSKIAEYAGYELEWSDEWSTCGDCGKAVRTQADSYGWQPSYVILNECELVCLECVDWPEYLKSIEDNPRKAVTRECNPAKYGYVRVSESQEYKSGFHPDQTDNPTKILAALQAKGIDRVIFRVADVGQFDIHFETWRYAEDGAEDES